MSQLNANIVAPATAGGAVDFQGTGPTKTPTFNGAIIGFGRREVVTVTGTTYTLQDSDMGKCIRTTSGSAVTITAPPSLPSFGLFHIRQAGAGLVTLAPGAGVTLLRRSTLAATGINASIQLHVVATSTYDLSGDLA